MVMVSGYVEIGECCEAWMVFLMMLRSSVRPDQAILVAALLAVMRFNKLELIESLRVMALKTGYESNVVVGTAFLNAYIANGSLEYGVKLFERMPERNEYSWSTMIAAFSQGGRLDDAIALYERDTEKGVGTQTAMVTAYAQNGRIQEARHIFDDIANPTVVTWNAMVAGYAQNGMLEEAKNIFYKIPVPNAASWAAMISGFIQNGQSREALEVFAEIHSSGIVPNCSNFTSAFFACANIEDIEMGRQIHCFVIKTRNQFNSFVGNGLISMYAKCKAQCITRL
ncbi:pentatricopeptide repeat-containing protein [Prunus yedoensis var. nudiflora]|uniref:Pentatricopeptide repeat-containing protein n=1 Tax=Prunus yedoensis var. nudiflora TaxID=2094558 RepID=A0A314YKT3_PRUYE|nr:pentatricopeptide repeat-containing protein [Prunus yedoensis var. nudiflora]